MSLTSWFRKMFSRPERPQEVELGRNELCWCGSGKKYKKCHLPQDEAEQREANYAALFAKRKNRGDGITRSGSKAADQRPPENREASRR